MKPTDHTGMKYGKLTVIERCEDMLNGRTTWKCVCDCGAIAEMPASSLGKKGRKSCGCKIEAIKKRGELISQIFGKLEVVSYVGRGYQGAKIWKCRCSCGNLVDRYTRELRTVPTIVDVLRMREYQLEELSMDCLTRLNT